MTADARIPGDLREFASSREGVDAIVQRIGRDTWDLVLVDQQGSWQRAVLSSKEACEAIAKELGVQPHDGWDDESIAKRMNRRDHWNEPGGQKRAL